ncbi:MAG: hypothetical protein QM765_32090 [Myxococcales bacterium]
MDCTKGDKCSAGLCVGTETCTTPDACHAGTGQCKPSTGKCEYALRAVGAPCTPSGTPATCTDYACTVSATCTGTPSPLDTTCGAGQVCAAGASCDPAGGRQCVIGGTPYAAGTVNPANVCQYCAPALSTSAWSPRISGTVCSSGACNAQGQCQPGCVIGSSVYANNAADPSNPCRYCDLAKSANDWSFKASGTACGSGKMCDATATCVKGCNIAGKVRLDLQENPVNPCEVCDVSASTSAWTAAPAGRNCAAGKVCEGKTCKDGCWIDGAFVAPQAVDAEDECQACLPAVTVGSYSRNDGATCSEGTCINGQCLGGCTITTITGSGNSIVETKTKYKDGTTNPQNECQACDINNPKEWSNKADGTECSGGKTCLGGGCGEGCVVNDKHYGPGEKNPENACLYCDPAQSTTKLSQMPDETVCGSGKMCYHKLCTAICLIKEGDTWVPYPEKSTFPDDPATTDVDESDTCKQCDPSRWFFGWSDCKKHSVCWEEWGGDDPDGRMCRLGCIERETPTAPLEYYENDEVNPKEFCQICDINYSNYHWKPRHEAVDCATYKVCNHDGHCDYGCGIGGHYFFPDEISPWNPCAICKEHQAVHSWNYLPAGTVCGDNEGVCHNNWCDDGCWIGGSYYGDGATHGGSGNGACEKCDTDKSRTGWQLNGGASCGTNQKCSTKTNTCCAAGAGDC